MEKNIYQEVNNILENTYYTSSSLYNLEIVSEYLSFIGFRFTPTDLNTEADFFKATQEIGVLTTSKFYNNHSYDFIRYHMSEVSVTDRFLYRSDYIDSEFFIEFIKVRSSIVEDYDLIAVFEYYIERHPYLSMSDLEKLIQYYNLHTPSQVNKIWYVIWLVNKVIDFNFIYKYCDMISFISSQSTLGKKILAMSEYQIKKLLEISPNKVKSAILRYYTKAVGTEARISHSLLKKYWKDPSILSSLDKKEMICNFNSSIFTIGLDFIENYIFPDLNNPKGKDIKSFISRNFNINDIDFIERNLDYLYLSGLMLNKNISKEVLDKAIELWRIKKGVK